MSTSIIDSLISAIKDFQTRIVPSLKESQQGGLLGAYNCESRLVMLPSLSFEEGEKIAEQSLKGKTPDLDASERTSHFIHEISHYYQSISTFYGLFKSISLCDQAWGLQPIIEISHSLHLKSFYQPALRWIVDILGQREMREAESLISTYFDEENTNLDGNLPPQVMLYGRIMEKTLPFIGYTHGMAALEGCGQYDIYSSIGSLSALLESLFKYFRIEEPSYDIISTSNVLESLPKDLNGKSFGAESVQEGWSMLNDSLPLMLAKSELDVGIFYSRPYVYHQLFREYLRFFPRAGPVTPLLLAIYDLSLDTPILPPLFEKDEKIGWDDIHPAWRFQKILISIKQNGHIYELMKGLKEYTHDNVLAFQNSICDSIGWQRPEILRKRIVELFATGEDLADHSMMKALLRRPLKAFGMKNQDVTSFALIRKSPFRQQDEIYVPPAIHYQDRIVSFDPEEAALLNHMYLSKMLLNQILVEDTVDLTRYHFEEDDDHPMVIIRGLVGRGLDGLKIVKH